MRFAKYVMALAAFVCFNAYAIVSPSEIGRMIDNGQFTPAEMALKDVQKVNDTAKVHYMLAQVYYKMGRSNDAKFELNKADSMDPGHTYTDGVRYQSIAASIRDSRILPTVVNSPTSLHNTDINVVSYIIEFVGIVIGFLLVGLGFSAYMKRKEKLRLQKVLDAAVLALRTSTSILVQDTDNAILHEKTASTPIPARISALELLKVKVFDLYDRTKNTEILDHTQCEMFDGERCNLVSTLKSIKLKTYNESTSSSSSFTVNTSTPKVRVSRRAPRSAAPPAQAPLATPSVSPHVVERETVVVNNSSPMSDVLMTSMVLDSLHESHRERERDEDRAYERNHRSDSGRNNWGDSPVTDSGNSSRWETPVDTGSNNDTWATSNNSDTADTGSDDNWGSSDSGSSNDD